MYKPFNLLSMLLLLVVGAFAFTSCSSDPDPDNPNAYYDFSVIWEVVDRGDYTVSEAQTLAANLTGIGEDLITHSTVKEAKELFNEFCEELRYQFATGYMTITLKARLFCPETNKTLVSKTFYIKPDGTAIKAPKMVVVVE